MFSRSGPVKRHAQLARLGRMAFVTGILMHVMKDIAVTLCGGCTSVMTALLLFMVIGFFNVQLYSFTVCFIIPVGAIGAGFIAALGYYFSARFIGHKPSGLLLLSILFV